jgi:eukaryotic-like serine/threonine-protein kinase
VVAFETICLVHPLLGDWVQQGEPELEEQALAGHLPWIEDPDDSRNRSSDGIPRQWVLSKSLQENFQKAFGPGLMNPLERPGTIGWAEAINRAADRTLVCSSCRGSYYHNFDCCPWCDEPRPTFAVAEVLLWDPDAIQCTDRGEVRPNPGIVKDSRGKPKLVDAVFLTQGECVTLDDRITYGTAGSKARLQVVFHEGRITVTALDGQSWTLDSGKRKQHVRDNPVPIRVGAKSTDWILHCGSEDSLHRVIRFKLHPGAQG